MQVKTPSPGGNPGPWFMRLLVVVLVVVCYFPALHGGLLWDDNAHVTAVGLRSWSGLARIWFELGATQQYYPVLHGAFWVEHRLWGDATFGYHLLNVSLHAASACLLALVLGRLGRRDRAAPPDAAPLLPAGAAWVAALLFAVHPVGVESVAWISEQKNTLSLVFYLFAAWIYLDFDSGRRWTAYALATGLFLLALGTKSVTATLPAALLVGLWWRRGRLDWRRDVGPLLPWFTVALASGLLTAWVERRFVGANGAAFDLSLGQRVLLAGRVIGFYAGKLAWPFDLMFIYPHWDVATAADRWTFWLAGAGLVTVGFWLLRHRSRGPLAGWLFFVGSLFPALGFFNVYPFLYSYVADHFQYLASLGLITAFAGGVSAALAAAPPLVRRCGWTVVGGLVVGLGWLTHRQARHYADASTLYRATLAQNPNCWMAHNNLAIALAEQPGREAEALAHYEAALRLRSDVAEVHYNYANELVKDPGRIPEAVAQYETALRLRPAYALAHYNLGNALRNLPGRPADAAVHYEEALRLNPDFADAHVALANLLADTPRGLASAIVHYREAIRLEPETAGVHFNLGNALVRLPGRLAEGLAEYERALLLKPDYVAVHVALGDVLGRQPGGVAKATAHYEEALRLDPGLAEIHNNLAVLYARQRRFIDARREWERALQLAPNYEDPRRNLQVLDRLQQN